MAWDPTPWVVGGGAEHSPEVARLLAYATSSGAEGIVEPADLRVRALNVPGAGFRVGAGAALVRNRFAGGQQQTYAVRNTAEHNYTDVSPTGSGGGRTDLVVARVIDPQYAGEVPSDPTDYQYVVTDVIRGVPSNTRAAAELNLGYPAIALAKITWPASTATITDAMITDLRRVALPRVERRLFAWNPTSSDEATQSLTTSTPYPVGSYWPNMRDNQGFWEVDIPEWATHANTIGTWAGVRVANGTANGWLWVRLGGTVPEGAISTQGTRWSLDQSGNGRESWHAADDIAIPEQMRGTRQMIRLLGARLSGTGAPVIDSATSVSIDIQFTEGPA